MSKDYSSNIAYGIGLAIALFSVRYCEPGWTNWNDSALDYRRSARKKADSGDHKGAIKDYSVAIIKEKKPEIKSHLFIFRAVSKYHIREYKSALYDCNKALKLDSTDDFNYIYRAMTKHKLHDDKGACEDLLKIKKLVKTKKIKNYRSEMPTIITMCNCDFSDFK